MSTTALSLREILYGYRPGFHSKISAQVAGEALAKQEEETGHLEPAETVERARLRGSTTHNHFKWSDAECGRVHRLKQAADLISGTYRVTEKRGPGKKKKQVLELQWVHAKVPSSRLLDYEDNGLVSTYISVEKAVADPRIKFDVLSEAAKVIAGLRRRIERVAGCQVDAAFLRKLEKQIEEERAKRKKKKG